MTSIFDVQRDNARRNCANWAQYVPKGGLQINGDKVVQMLLNHVESGNVKREAKELLKLLSETGWRVAAAAHEGGHGGGGHAPDQNLHITLNVNGASYHIRITKTYVILSITH